MLRTAEEIYQDATLKSLGNNPTGTRYDIVILAMNMGRKEAIEECARKAKVKMDDTFAIVEYSVDKQSLLSLIKELK